MSAASKALCLLAWFAVTPAVWGEGTEFPWGADVAEVAGRILTLRSVLGPDKEHTEAPVSLQARIAPVSVSMQSVGPVALAFAGSRTPDLSRIQDQQWRNSQMQSRIQDQQWRNSQMQSRIQDQQWRNSQMLSRIQDQQWRNSQMQSRIQDQQWRNSQMLSRIQDQQWRNSQMQSRIQDQQWRNSQMQSRIQDQQWRNSQMLSRIQDQQWKLADMRSRMSDQQWKLQNQLQRQRFDGAARLQSTLENAQRTIQSMRNMACVAIKANYGGELMERANKLAVDFELGRMGGRTASWALGKTSRVVSYARSFEGPITVRWARPGETWLHYTDRTFDQGRFLTKARFGTASEATDALHLRPYGNYASLRQEVTAMRRTLVFEGRIRNSTQGIRQTLIIDRGALQFGLGKRY